MQKYFSIEKGNYSPSLELAFATAKLFELEIGDVFSFEVISDDKK